MKHIKTDVICVAAGPSGLAAAVAAAENGADVVVFEKASIVGGAANMGMGPFGLGTRQQKEQMIDINVERAFKMFMDYTHWRVDANLVRRYFENSADTIAWLEEKGVEFAGAYKYFPKSEATWHVVAVNGGIGRNGGAIMNKALLQSAKENGVEFYLGTPVTRLIKEDGRVVGVIAKGPDGEEIEARASAVILATGGAGDNPEMIRERTGWKFRENMFNFAIPGLKGDGVRMAREAGAACSDMTLEIIYVLPNCISGPECVTAVFSQPNLMVNAFGDRFLNEEEMQNNTYTGNAISIQKNFTGYSILDSSILRRYRRKGLDVTNFVQHPETVDDFDSIVTNYISQNNEDVFKADTLEALAEWIGTDPKHFVNTVETYNKMCESKDTLFFKDPRYMLPISRPPYYIGKFRPGGYGTLGGIKINAKCEVLDEEWNSIPGLYAAGTDTCAIYGDSYMFLLPGNTMGYCLNTGRFAGEAAADYAFEAKE